MTMRRGFLPAPLLGGAHARLGQGSRLSVPSDPAADPSSSLSPEEAAEYRAWESLQKTFFLMSYQWLAVSAAQGLERLDGSSYTGVFAEGIRLANESLKVSGKYAKSLPEAPLEDIGRATEVLKEAVEKTLPSVTRALRKYRMLRDRVAQELAAAGESVAYEVVGDDPQAPGTIYPRRLGPEGALDVDAVYSEFADDRMVREGTDIEKGFASLGVPFRRLDLSGANPGAGAMPILGHLITLIVGVLTFFYLYRRSTVTGSLSQATVDLVKKDETLTADQKADLIAKVMQADSFFGAFFGPTFSWVSLLAAATILGLAFWVLPRVLHDRPWGSPGKKSYRLLEHGA
jgi:hypothetical protein